MSSTKSQLRLMGAFAALATLALAVSCKGFFVKPTLTSIAVGPASPSIQTGTTNNTVQMFAAGTFNDGSTGNPAVLWSISPNDNSIATISTGGLVTSVATGTATVTATATQNPSISGTQSLTVIVGCIQSITLNPTSGSIANGGNTFVNIAATAQTCNGPVVITSVATWTSSNTTIATVSAGVVTATGSTNADGTVTISASAGGITSSPNAIVTVSGY
jgi:Big-like domain-containing protein